MPLFLMVRVGGRMKTDDRKIQMVQKVEYFNVDET